MAPQWLGLRLPRFGKKATGARFRRRFVQRFCPHHPRRDGLFDKVLVITDDQTVKAHRMGILQRIAALASGIPT
jgi:glycyl-tRNA synthetase beta subunit